MIKFWNGDVGGVIEPEQITPWNTIKLDGSIVASDTAPLFLKSISGSVGFEIDRRTRKNRSGQKKTATGANSPKWTMQFIWWTKEQYDAWQAYLPQINPHLAANRLKTRRIEHPFLSDYEITQCVVYKMDIPQWESQAVMLTLYCEEVAAPETEVKKALTPTTDPAKSKTANDFLFLPGQNRQHGTPGNKQPENSFSDDPPQLVYGLLK